ncbi:MAG: protein GlmU [Desulfobacterales bacterium]
MASSAFDPIGILIDKGVRIPNPASVEIGPEVDLARIAAEGVVLHTGTKIFGRRTLILQGARIGYESPVTIENCHIGPSVELSGGFFRGAVFLEKAAMGLGAHVREGTILEEGASGAHTVGLKQTILFPFVTLGSLINFCDCLMSGGTSPKDHSEVGSSYIHFNYTPNQDKATPSLLGDVPAGVMLNQRPIFLGGQGGLVGPCRLAFGTIVAAGCVYRKDVLQPGRLVFEGGIKGGSIPFTPGLYRGVRRIVAHNLTYLANLAALKQWYTHVRAQFVSPDFPEALLEGLLAAVDAAIDERLRQFERFCAKLPESARRCRETARQGASEALLKEKAELVAGWPAVKAIVMQHKDGTGPDNLREAFLEQIQKSHRSAGKNYLTAIQGLEPAAAAAGTRWLQAVVDRFSAAALKPLPSFKRIL